MNSDSSLSTKWSLATIGPIVALYILSGCAQPLLMTVLRHAGLADSGAQLYMFFYYIGPASSIFLILKDHVVWPSRKTIQKGSAIALFDIAAQTLNYTGASLAGPTIFAIIYSSVTVWAALYSQLFLGRSMDVWQWAGVVAVFGGLAVTATDSLELGPQVMRGVVMVTAGSSMHGLFYVMSEAVMTVGDEKLSVLQNCATQGLTATASFLMWQLIYTVPRFDEKIWEPMQIAGTTPTAAAGLLILFACISLIHSVTFYHTLRHLPGGSTSAGVFKGLQAVLVFLFTDWAFCGRVGGTEMCFSTTKLFSLLTVAGGVVWYGIATREKAKHGNKSQTDGYVQIAGEDEGIEIEPV